MSIRPLDEQNCPLDIQMSIGHIAEVLLKEETYSMHSFLYLGFLPEVYFCVLLLSKQLSFSSKHKSHFLEPPV